MFSQFLPQEHKVGAGGAQRAGLAVRVRGSSYEDEWPGPSSAGEPPPPGVKGAREGGLQAKSWSWDVCREPLPPEERVRRLSALASFTPGKGVVARPYRGRGGFRWKLGLKAGDGGGASNWGLGQPKSDEGDLLLPLPQEPS